MNRTFSSEINADYKMVKKNMRKFYKKNKFSTDNLDFTLESLNTNHKYYYFFKVMHNEIDYKNEDTDNAIKDFSEGFYDYFWLLLNARYKSSIISFRSAWEMLIKGFIREIDPDSENNSFSNNIERGIKVFRETEERKLVLIKKREFKTFLHKNYTEKTIGLYSNFSNIVHGNYQTETDSFNDFLMDVMNIDLNFNTDKIEQIVNYTNQSLEMLLELFIIVNFEELSNKMNPYEFNIIYNNLNSERFQKYKNNYNLDIYRL